jgi:hypothetical protein
VGDDRALRRKLYRNKSVIMRNLVGVSDKKDCYLLVMGELK